MFACSFINHCFGLNSALAGIDNLQIEFVSGISESDEFWAFSDLRVAFRPPLAAEYLGAH